MVFQYGKVGSTSIRRAGWGRRRRPNGKYCPFIQKTYNEKIIQVHKHEVAKDILSKYKNILIINIVRLPINRNISAFYQNIKRVHCPNYDQLSINEIIQIYEKTYSVKQTDNWMKGCFELLNIDIDNFKFDKVNKYNKLTSNGNDILLFRFEDFEYITSNILPKYNIFLNDKKNVGSSKFYSELYNTHKKTYKISDIEKNNIINSKFTNIYYSKEEIQEHIKKYDSKEEIQEHIKKYDSKEEIQEHIKKYDSKEEIQEHIKKYE